jgi:hypothetical protein
VPASFLAETDSFDSDFLEKAYLARDVHLMYLPVDTKWDPYRRDARLVALLTRCGFAPGL